MSLECVCKFPWKMLHNQMLEKQRLIAHHQTVYDVMLTSLQRKLFRRTVFFFVFISFTLEFISTLMYLHPLSRMLCFIQYLYNFGLSVQTSAICELS